MAIFSVKCQYNTAKHNTWSIINKVKIAYRPQKNNPLTNYVIRLLHWIIKAFTLNIFEHILFFADCLG